MTRINKKSVVAILILIIGYFPFSPVRFNMDLEFISTHVASNIIQAASLLTLPSLAWIASLIIIKGAHKSNGLNKIIMYLVLLATVAITINVNTLSNEEKMLKLSKSDSDLFAIGKTYLTSGLVKQSHDKAVIYFSRSLIKKNSKEQIVEINNYLSQIVTGKDNVDIQPFHTLASIKKSFVRMNNKTSVGLSFEQTIKKTDDQMLAQAQNNLSVRYYNGQGVEKDFKQAVYWTQKAADQGHVDGQNNLGVMYEKGHGVEKDFKQAVYWYQKAADQGQATAQSNLGGLYYTGQGVEKNFKQAVYWFQKAADQRYADAQFNLGAMYRNGQGVEKDFKQAIFWFQKAANQGYVEAKKAIEYVKAIK